MSRSKSIRWRRRFIAEVLFWFHTAVIVGITLSGFFIPWWVVILVLLGVRAQQVAFHGCILTLLEQREGGMRRGMAYYQLAARRFFGVRLRRRGVYAVSIAHNLLTLAVLLLANIYGLKFTF